MKSFEIVHIRTGKGGSLYSIKFAGAEMTELDRFLESEDFQRREDFVIVHRRLTKMVEESGFLEPEEWRWIVPISSPTDAVCEIRGKSWEGIRIYALRRGGVLLITGFAMIKRT